MCRDIEEKIMKEKNMVMEVIVKQRRMKEKKQIHIQTANCTDGGTLVT